MYIIWCTNFFQHINATQIDNYHDYEKKVENLCPTIAVTFTNTQKLLLYLKKNLGGGESWDLFSNQQMGLEVQKNLGLLMLSEVEGGS